MTMTSDLETKHKKKIVAMSKKKFLALALEVVFDFSIFIGFAALLDFEF